jgi:hypothetical protein
MINQNNAPFFAEVIESSLTQYTGQSWEWKEFPAFGSLLSVDNGSTTILGVVTNAATGSMDATRTPFAYQKTEAELQQEQPQIFAFLKTSFTVQVCGYINNDQSGKIIFAIPPSPSKMHAFIRPSNQDLVSQFYANADFLNVLYGFAYAIPNPDELLLSILRQIKQRKLLSENLLAAICSNFSLLTGNDYRRLKVFLSRVQQLD